MSIPNHLASEVYADARVSFITGGGSHDWLYTETLADALALIAEYGLDVKYAPTRQGSGWGMAVR